MIPFDLTVAFVSGGLLALGAKEQIRRGQVSTTSKPFLYSLVWITFVYTPSAMFFYHGWTDWNLMYTFDSSQNQLLSAVVIRLDAMALISTFVLSFLMARNWIKKGSDSRVLIAMALAVVFLGILLFGLYNRTFYVAPYPQWVRGQGVWLFTSVLFYSNLVAAVTDLGPLAYLYLKFAREGRQVFAQGRIGDHS